MLRLAAILALALSTLGPPPLAAQGSASYGEVSPNRPSAAKADAPGTPGPTPWAALAPMAPVAHRVGTCNVPRGAGDNEGRRDRSIACARGPRMAPIASTSSSPPATTTTLPSFRIVVPEVGPVRHPRRPENREDLGATHDPRRAGGCSRTKARRRRFRLRGSKRAQHPGVHQPALTTARPTTRSRSFPSAAWSPGMEAVDAWYAGYGEDAGSGIRSGRQGPIFEGGATRS